MTGTSATAGAGRHDGDLTALADAEQSMHRRAQLACAAATARDLPGEFRAWEADGLRMVMTTSPGLGFLNTVTGLDEPSARALPGVLETFRAAGAPSPAVVTRASSPALEAVLRALGLAPTGTRPIAFVALPAAGLPPHHVDIHPPDVTGVRTAAERATFLDVLVAGYSTTVDVQRLLRAEHAADLVRGFLAWAGGEPVGAAAMSLHGRSAVLGGAATLPDHRGSGVQTALLRHRLVVAARTGAWAATATAAAGSSSARNLSRAGFRVELRTAWAGEVR